ncbi:hypothetical protein [Halegenticoccus tardaugens]|uniref:hypothetical protein n=1 Tax=Halegenticoccus tardaugens TaxID=2071624 RepID=UPI0013E96088|nr:hypothetical protein [Halegenticoccus tardaugens]
MAVTDARDGDLVEEPRDPDFCISACRTSPNRTVFTEDGNQDGWIATDLTVTLER